MNDKLAAFDARYRIQNIHNNTFVIYDYETGKIIGRPGPRHEKEDTLRFMRAHVTVSTRA